MRKALAVGRKELRQIVRDRRTLMILLFVPAFFLLVYGYALNWDIRHIALAVDDRDRSPDSRALVSAFVNSGYFDLVAIVDSDAELTRLMDRNEARAVLVVPPGMSRDLQRGKTVAVQILLNGDNANTATTVMAYARTIVQTESVRRRVARGETTLVPLLAAEPRVWYNPQLRSTLFLVPGLIAYIAMITAVVSTALSVVREKERGTMEQVRMAPLDAFFLRRRQDDSVFRHLAGLGDGDCARRDGAVRPADARIVAAAARGAVAVSRRRARARSAHFEHRRDAAGRIPAGAALVLSPDLDAFGVHLSHREHAPRSCGASPISCPPGIFSSR